MTTIHLTLPNGTTTTYPSTYYWNVNTSGTLTVYNADDEPTHTLAPGQWVDIKHRHTTHEPENTMSAKVATALDEFINAYKKGLDTQ